MNGVQSHPVGVEGCGSRARGVVALLAVIYTLATVGLQGTVSPANLAKNSSSALVYTAQAISGGG